MDYFPSDINLDFTDWTTWAALATGLLVTTLVIVVGTRFQRRRRLRAGGSWDGAPSWEQMLELARERKRQRAAAGLPPDDDDLPPEQLLGELMPGLPSSWRGSLRKLSSQLELVAAGERQRSSAPVRWGNPTEVYFSFATYPGTLHGLVISRSDDWLTLLADKEIPLGTALQVRSIEAPAYVPTIDVEVSDCRKVGKNFLLSGHFCGEVPWNVRAWLG